MEPAKAAEPVKRIEPFALEGLRSY